MRTILTLPWPPALPSDLLALLDRHLALRLPGALPLEACRGYAEGVYRGRDLWIRDFNGEQFSLGRAWYTHLEQGKSHEYFASARASDQGVERHLPGMQAAMRGLLAALTGADVQARRGWCGPGVHVFPAGEWVARRGGVIHSDIEGLSEGHVDARAPAVSMVLMLQPPDEGGGLRLWDQLHHDDDALDEDDLEGVHHETAAYDAGDLLIFDSYRLHQIQPFEGSRDRLSVTAHGALLQKRRWEVWF